MRLFFFFVLLVLGGIKMDASSLENATKTEVFVNGEQDSLALVALYNATDGANWTNTWDLSQPMSTWFGVTLNEEGCVSELNLVENRLTGILPAELGNLDRLTQLSLQTNQLMGSIPLELGNLTNLIKLFLYGNKLTGSIPPELGNLTNLTRLSINNNQLIGSIPIELGNLINLVQLSLGSNQLTNNIPSELGNLINLTALNLSICQLTGSIPPELGNLTELKNLNLHVNKLSGEIPKELGNLNNLTQIILYRNELTGSLPTELGNLDNLKKLWLAFNNITGSLPAELGRLTNLELLDLSNNQLSGNIPLELGNLTNLTWLILNNNQLAGNLPTELENLQSIARMYLQNNQFFNCFPEGFTIFCPLNFSSETDKDGYNFMNNPTLPWQGDFTRFCNGESQIGATCDDGNPNTNNDIINENCECNSFCSSLEQSISATICPNGTYQLGNQTLGTSGNYSEVFQTTMGCDSTINLTLVVESRESLGLADAGSNQTICDNIASLSANQPPNTNGFWESENEAIIINPTTENTTAENLQLGENLFTWTLSNNDCTNYDSAIVSISVSDQPTANDDVYSTSSDKEITINVLENDVFSDPNDLEILQLSAPKSGILVEENIGIFRYTPTNGFSGTTNFEYKICQKDCANCAIASVIIDIKAAIIEIENEIVDPKLFFVPSGFTPNGDGVNDEFVIPTLEDEPEKYPEAEAVIFNRWGDIVFHAKPYTNNWKGNNQKNGKALPAGTYYYIIRLDVGEGIIKQGELTILK